MKDWLEILSSLLGSLARIGFIIVLFSIGVIFAESRGLSFPAVVSEWSSVALVLGIAFIVVEGVLLGFRGIASFFGWLANRAALIAQERRHKDEAIQNLRTLDSSEFELLIALLRSGDKRFQLGTQSAAPTLIQKDILTFKTQVSAYSWICELSRPIEKNRAEILQMMEKAAETRPV